MANISRCNAEIIKLSESEQDIWFGGLKKDRIYRMFKKMKL